MAVKIVSLQRPEGPINIRMILYGEPGVGKTTLCDTLPNTLFLEFDPQGHYSILDSKHGNKVAEVTSIQDLETIYTVLARDLHGIENIVFDSMTSLLELSIDFQRSNARDAITGMDMTKDLEIELRDYKLTFRQISKVLMFFGKLPVNCIYVCHTRSLTEGAATQIVPDLIPSLRNHLCKNASLIGRMMMRREVDQETQKVVNNRYLVCSPQAGFLARSRLGELNRNFKNPDLAIIFGLVQRREAEPATTEGPNGSEEEQSD